MENTSMKKNLIIIASTFLVSCILFGIALGFLIPAVETQYANLGGLDIIDNFNPAYGTDKRIRERFSCLEDDMVGYYSLSQIIKKIGEEDSRSVVIAEKVSSKSYYLKSYDVGYTKTVMQVQKVIETYDGGELKVGDKFSILELYCVRPDKSIKPILGAKYLLKVGFIDQTKWTSYEPPFPNPLIKNSTSYVMVIDEPDKVKGVSLEGVLLDPKYFEETYFEYYAVELSEEAVNTKLPNSNKRLYKTAKCMWLITKECNELYSEYWK